MTTIWTGLAIGSVYVLVALTYNIVLSATGIFNFAQAQMVMVGAFIAYIGSTANDWPVPLIVAVALAVGAVLGALEERVAIWPLRRSPGLGYLVTTLGFAVALEGLAYMIYGSSPRNVEFFIGETPFSLLGGRLLPIDASLIALALAATLVLHLIGTRTRWGLACRATTSDRDAAALRGVNIARVSLLSFTVAGALGAALGLFVAPLTGVSMNLGNSLVVYSFMILAVGGFGSYGGALLGGLAIGIVQAECQRWMSAAAPPVILFGILLLVLLLRPHGLFGVRRLRTV